VSLRKRIADSETVQNGFANLAAAYLRWVHRSSTWERHGFSEMERLVASGEPVIVVLWHQRLLMTPWFFPTHLGPVCSITSSARAGSMAGRIQTKFGFQTIAMSSHKRHVALSRAVLGKIRDGVSIGIAADGPRGPERVLSTVPLVWARTSGKRVFLVSFAARKAREAGTWDRMLLPAPWNNGVFICREWRRTVPRKAPPEEMEALRLDMQEALDALTADCDRQVGREPDWPR
jgi:lysophospholipid acyltransferase (LPLAT)-like uncharacterized protein